MRLRGFELESNYNFVGHALLHFNVAYNDAIYTSYDNAPAPVEFLYTGAAKTVSLTGRPIPLAPKWSGTIGFYDDVSIADGYVAYGYFNERAQAREALANPASKYDWQGGYALTDLGLGVKTSNNRYDAQLYVRNLFDRRYFIGIAQATATATTPYSGILGDPFRIGVTLRAKF